MGNCNSFCSKNESLGHTQPDMDQRITRQGLPELVSLSSFHNAITTGNTTLATYYVGENPHVDMINTNYNRETPLHSAVRHRQHDMIQYLLDQQASPDTQDEKAGDTPLHIAVRIADLKTVKILMKHNADTSILNDEGESAVFIALCDDKKGHREIVKVLVPDDNELRILRMNHEKQFLRPSVAPVALRHRLSEFVAGLMNVDSNSGWTSKLDSMRLNELTDDLFEEIQDDIAEKEYHLKPLEGWLEKKQHSPPYFYHRRWAIVKDKYMLWSERQMSIHEHTVTAKEKKRWGKCIKLKKIILVEGVDTSNKTFRVKLDKTEFLFKANTKALRDYWVENLNQTISFVKSAGFASKSKV
eukprot:195429_1